MHATHAQEPAAAQDGEPAAGPGPGGPEPASSRGGESDRCGTGGWQREGGGGGAAGVEVRLEARVSSKRAGREWGAVGQIIYPSIYLSMGVWACGRVGVWAWATVCGRGHGREEERERGCEE
jgi:hypothetical protein